MTEENNSPETNPPPTEAQLRAELESARSGNKLLRIAAIVLASLFLLLAGTAFYIYNRIERTKAAFEEAFQGGAFPFPGHASQTTMPPAGGSLPGSASMPASTLGLLSGSISGPSPMPLNVQQGEEVYAALAKYENRPIVKEFIADLKKDPDMARAFGEKDKGGSPLKVMAYIQSAKGMEKLVAKYAMRPDFMKLMMDVMKDPALRPLLKNVPGGLPQPGAGGPPPTRAQPSPGPQAEPAGEDGGVSLTLDPSAISGTPAAKPAPARARKVPPPIDNQ
ncbi:MAG TPA: hypothetical protein DCS63_03295 [Elusimicrobia bacterium]|nr:hypothetical protein [Elusimicrobiota bacterium]